MNISGDYGTELLLRYTEERLSRELEQRRVENERAAEDRRAAGTRLSRFARFFFREEVAAGGPEWVRPSATAHHDTRPETAGTTKPPVPALTDTRVPSDVITPGNDTVTTPGNDTAERMPVRALVGSRR
ncbi:hypothetical protein ACLRGF_11600 [Mycetocola zhadangensis]|uniref:hypothetical protein n=1 Tax=Mycetocola zhadangensis TaxID=1164595 RepID=UPI003A4D3524